MLKFEWDPLKARTNLDKHSVAFEEAASVFGDPFAITFRDPDHSLGEMRWLTFGVSKSGRLLAVVHSARTRSIRIISARAATRRERKVHEQG
jgi:hypothetical protein